MDWNYISDNKYPDRFQEVIICSDDGKVKSAIHIGDGKWNTFLNVVCWQEFPEAPDGVAEASLEPVKKKRGRKKKNG